MQKKLLHGGMLPPDVQKEKNEYLDFSVNTSPLGMPERVKKAVEESVKKLEEYPAYDSKELCEAIGKWQQIKPENIVCGNGASEMISLLVNVLQPKKAALIAPCFSGYERALQGIGCAIQYIYCKEENNFTYTSEILQQLDAETDILILCQPNNPTGCILEEELQRDLISYCREKHIFLAVDECFMEFLTQDKQCSMKRWLAEYNQLFIINAFTKLYAMAGIRLGFGMCENLGLLQKMKDLQPEWSVSTLAQISGIEAAKDEAYRQRVQQLVQQEKEYVTNQLKKMGYIVFPSHANFLLWKESKKLQEKLLQKGAKNLQEMLLQKGILIRDCSNFHGLGEGYYRSCIRKREDNMKLLEALQSLG